MPNIKILQQEGHDFLWINGKPWMWTIDDEQEAQELINQDAFGRVLVAGYGLGVLQGKLVNNPRVSSVTTMEILPGIIEANEQRYGKLHGEVIVGDFFKFEDDDKYDCVIGDVWIDIAATALELYNQFEAHAKTLVKPDGKILAWGQEFFIALNFYNKYKHLHAE